MSNRIIKNSSRPLSLLIFALFVSGSALHIAAQAAPATIESEQAKLIRAPYAIATHGPDLFGDKVNTYTGALEFLQTDVSLPGNNTLPVTAARRLAAGGMGNEGRGMFAHWDLDIPRVYGMFSDEQGWRKLDANNQPTVARCTNFGAPPPVYRPGSNNNIKYRAAEYWHGNMLYVPGTGDQEILRRNTASNPNVPTDGIPTLLVTKELWAIRCLPTLASTTAGTPANERGEGFLAISPEGTQYRFDWLASRDVETISKPYPYGYSFGHWTIARKEVSIFPTLITDKFGNTVRYTYSGQNVLSIRSADGAGNNERVLTFTYLPGTNFVQYVSDGVRTWTYAYATGHTGKMQLTTVTLPDNSKWDLTGMATGFNSGLLETQMNFADPDPDASEPCDQYAGDILNPPISGSMVHPSGAKGTFVLDPMQHGRNGVSTLCYSDGVIGMPARAYTPRYYYNFALSKKTISGPGLPEMSWTTTYDTMFAGFECPGGCGPVDPSIISVTNPKGEVTRYSFGNTFGVDEGMLKRVDIGWNGSTALQTTTTRYNYSFPELVGFTDQVRGDYKTSGRHIPVDQKIITQQGVDFTWAVPLNTDFDTYRRPVRVVKSNSLGASRTETTSYFNQTNKWMLGQIASVTEASTGMVPVLNEYNGITGNLESIKKFGRLEAVFTYNTDGTIASRADGLNHTTSFSSYKRGIPRLTTFADGTTETYIVNDIGKITARTEQNNFTTGYGYDTIGRLSSISPPLGDSVAWNQTFVEFQQVASPEFTLDAGHWRQTVTTGNSRTIKYFDAFWQPVYTYISDLANDASTSSVIKNAYDYHGNVTFTSFPQRNFASLAGGIHDEYDALDRKTVSTTDSELGPILISNTYDSGFKTTTINGRGLPTVYSYQAYDQPSTEMISTITAPAGVNVSITRDIFGKAKVVTRSGGGKSASRQYVYDSAQQLCKTIEPETGATIQDYDLANNVSWKASGLSLLSNTTCDTASVAVSKKITYGYDALNRLLSTSYGDSSPGIARTYTPDGLPLTVNSGGSNWTYGYNRRRLNNVETLTFGGVTYTISKAYDANASLSQLTYPDNSSIAYNPNALGVPTTVGTFANEIAYYPNGAIKSFNYGNGIAHTLTQNVRGLPDHSIDSGILNDVYTFDKNGNVAAIQDSQENISSRTMVYDDLDRLTRTSAPAIWGEATYEYDSLDNLTSSIFTGGAGIARTMAHNFPDPTTNRLMSLTGSANFSLAYNYDAQGNIIQRGSQTYVFDLGNRMVQATGKATYGYDGLGRRTSVVGIDGSTRLQMYSGDGKLLYAGPTASTKTKYIYLHNHVIAEVSGAGTQYMHTDGLGSTVARTNVAGGLISRSRYEPYGRTAMGAEPTLGFTGHMNDVETGLTYMQQRYYDPVAGRMLSIDPVITDANTGGSFNRYAYAANSPYKYIDPDGRQEHAAEGFGNQFAKDAASGNTAVYEPFVKPVAVATLIMAVGPPVALAIIMRHPTMVVRTTQAGEKAVRITKPNGSVKDISPARVKEYTPSTHPKAPPGTLNKVKFENPLPGSKGFKREPTTEELKILKDAK